MRFLPSTRFGIHGLERVRVLLADGVRRVSMGPQDPLGGQQTLHSDGAPCMDTAGGHTNLAVAVAVVVVAVAASGRCKW